MKLLTDLHQITDISGPPDFSRSTIQLTVSIYISKHFSHLNVIKYILKHLQHAFQLLIYYTIRYRWNSSRIYIKSQTFPDHQTSRGTQLIDTFDLYFKTLLVSKRNQIYSEASSTRFSAINLLYFTFTDETPHGSTSNHRHFRTTRLLAEHNSIETFRFIYQKTLHL